MNTERVTKLVDALVSGEFKQTRGALRRGDAYCCLGLACDIYRRETGEGEWESDKMDTLSVFILDGERACLVPPQKVADWYGFKRVNPAFNDSLSMAEMNDCAEFSFKAIGEMVKKRLDAGIEDLPPPPEPSYYS